MSQKELELITIAITVGVISLVFIFTLFLIFAITVLKDKGNNQ